MQNIHTKHHIRCFRAKRKTLNIPTLRLTEYNIVGLRLIITTTVCIKIQANDWRTIQSYTHANNRMGRNSTSSTLCNSWVYNCIQRLKFTSDWMKICAKINTQRATPCVEIGV